MSLKPAAELAKSARKPYPGESADYGVARTELLTKEIELRRLNESVADMRRKLPLGPVPKDYAFLDRDERQIGLADMFGDKNTLVTYFWMFGPQRARPCPMCTSFIGSVDTPLRDLKQKIAFAVLGRSPVSRQLAFAIERGWRNIDFYQCVGDDFPRDYRGLAPNGDEWPALIVWKKYGDTVRHFWAGELGGTQDPNQDPRGAPEIAPLWTMLDLTPAGRDPKWYPKLDY